MCRKGLNPGPNDVFGLEFDVRPLKEPQTIDGLCRRNQTSQVKASAPIRRPTGKVEVSTVPYYSEHFIKRSIPFPAAYLVPVPEPAAWTSSAVMESRVERLREKAAMEVELFRVKETQTRRAVVPGPSEQPVKGEYVKEKVACPAGATCSFPPPSPSAAWPLTFSNPKATTAWSLELFRQVFRLRLGRQRRRSSRFPVYRLLKPVALAKEVVR